MEMWRGHAETEDTSTVTQKSALYTSLLSKQFKIQNGIDNVQADAGDPPMALNKMRLCKLVGWSGVEECRL